MRLVLAAALLSKSVRSVWPASLEARSAKESFHFNTDGRDGWIPFSGSFATDLQSQSTLSSRGRITNAEPKAEGNQKHAVKECDPHASIDPDVGLLCDYGLYCQESSDSALGGYCLEEELIAKNYERHLSLDLSQLGQCSSPPMGYPNCTCDDDLYTFYCFYEYCADYCDYSKCMNISILGYTEVSRRDQTYTTIYRTCYIEDGLELCGKREYLYTGFNEYDVSASCELTNGGRTYCCQYTPELNEANCNFAKCPGDPFPGEVCDILDFCIEPTPFPTAPPTKQPTGAPTSNPPVMATAEPTFETGSPTSQRPALRPDPGVSIDFPVGRPPPAAPLMQLPVGTPIRNATLVALAQEDTICYDARIVTACGTFESASGQWFSFTGTGNTLHVSTSCALTEGNATVSILVGTTASWGCRFLCMDQRVLGVKPDSHCESGARLRNRFRGNQDAQGASANAAVPTPNFFFPTTEGLQYFVLLQDTNDTLRFAPGVSSSALPIRVLDFGQSETASIISEHSNPVPSTSSTFQMQPTNNPSQILQIIASPATPIQPPRSNSPTGYMHDTSLSASQIPVSEGSYTSVLEPIVVPLVREENICNGAEISTECGNVNSTSGQWFSLEGRGNYLQFYSACALSAESITVSVMSGISDSWGCRLLCVAQQILQSRKPTDCEDGDRLPDRLQRLLQGSDSGTSGREASSIFMLNFRADPGQKYFVLVEGQGLVQTDLPSSASPILVLDTGEQLPSTTIVQNPSPTSTAPPISTGVIGDEADIIQTNTDSSYEPTVSTAFPPRLHRLCAIFVLLSATVFSGAMG